MSKYFIPAKTNISGDSYKKIAIPGHGTNVITNSYITYTATKTAATPTAEPVQEMTTPVTEAPTLETVAAPQSISDPLFTPTAVPVEPMPMGITPMPTAEPALNFEPTPVAPTPVETVVTPEPTPVAEFTPKNVETPELRTALVYEARIIVEDPDNILKLGAPVTISFEE